MESLQQKISRIRPPRVQITYDVEVGGATEKKELPLVVGVMSSLSGVNEGNAEILGDVKSRKFITIDRDNFSSVMDSQQPKLEITPVNWLTKYELSIIKRLKNLAMMAIAIEEKDGEIFKLSGCNMLLNDQMGAAFASKDALAPSMFTIQKMIPERTELSESVRDFLAALIRFLSAYMPIYDELTLDGFHTNVAELLSVIVSMVNQKKVSEDYLTKLEALEKIESEKLPFTFQFKTLDDFSPLSLLKQDERLQALVYKKQKLFDLLHKLESSPKILEFISDIILGKTKEIDEEAIKEAMPLANNFQQSYIREALLELIQEVEGGYISLSPYKADDDEEFVLESLYIIKLLLNRIADLNEYLSNQVDAILHDDDFQKLEGSWRGMHYLVMNTDTGPGLKLRLLNISRKELQDDLEKAVEFDQSQLFKKIYEAEYGTFGGHPYSLLLGDFEFGRNPQDVALLSLVSGVAAAAHSPFISGASAGLFDMKDFTELDKPRALSGIFESAELMKWNSFRNNEDSRYVTLVLPHVMMRLPYDPVTNPLDGFNYKEDTEGGEHGNFLWSNAAYALVQRITDAYSKYSWCAAIRGMEGGGAVTDLPVYEYRSSTGDQEMVCPTEVSITDRREKELSDLGFISLVHRKGEDLSVFFGGQTTQRSKVYDTPQATANARLSAVLPYMLAASRFAHYLKVIVRDKVGGFLTAENLQEYLNRWINDYVLAKDDAGHEIKAKYPLREARVDVFEVAGRPGVFNAIVYLRPHFQLEELTSSIRLVAELPAAAS